MMPAPRLHSSAIFLNFLCSTRGIDRGVPYHPLFRADQGGAVRSTASSASSANGGKTPAIADQRAKVSLMPPFRRMVSLIVFSLGLGNSLLLRLFHCVSGLQSGPIGFEVSVISHNHRWISTYAQPIWWKNHANWNFGSFAPDL